MAVFHGTKGRFYVDGEEYFSALYEAMIHARRSIYILGWDINSTFRLLPEGKKDNSHPVVLGKLLSKLARDKGIEIKILAWDFSTFFVLERELLSKIKIGWENERNIEFRYDDNIPIFGSHHQKIVIVDEQLAFCGGLDLTRDRWDTCEHSPDNKFRVNASGNSYPPFHDVQVGVMGEAVEGFLKVFKDRWRKASGKVLSSSGSSIPTTDFDMKPEFENATVAISRTLPQFKDSPGVTEVKQLYFDLIKNTRHFLYIENQYFTSDEVAQAISDSLKSEQGPNICIVLPQKNKGIFEKRVLSNKQNEIVRRLRADDRHHRLFIFYPEIPHLKSGDYLKVHSKVMISDDQWARIGSSNLTKRSMNLDTECDFTLEADRPETRKSILSFKSRLISEHSSIPQNEVYELLSANRHRELLQRIRNLENQTEIRRLKTFVTKDHGRLPSTAAELIDLEIPLALDQFIDHQVIQKFEPRKRRFDRSFRRIFIAGFLLLLAFALWRSTPVSQIFSQVWVQNTFVTLDMVEFSLVYSILVFTILSVAFVPLNLLILVMATVQESVSAIVCILGGSLLGAAVSYLAGRKFGAAYIQQRWPLQYRKLKKSLMNQRLLPVIIVRIVPVAPFNLVNILSGAMQVHFGKYIAGTLIGITPGTLALVYFQKSLLSVILSPNLEHFLAVILALAVLIAAYRYAKKRLAL